MSLEDLVREIKVSLHEGQSDQAEDAQANEILTDFETAGPLLIEKFTKFSVQTLNPGDVVRQHSSFTPYNYPKKGELAIVLDVYDRHIRDDKGNVKNFSDDVLIAAEGRAPKRGPFWVPISIDSRFLELVKPAHEVFPDGLPNFPISSTSEKTSNG